MDIYVFLGFLFTVVLLDYFVSPLYVSFEWFSQFQMNTPVAVRNFQNGLL